MPLDRIVLIICIVIAAAGATVWLAVYLSVAADMPLLGLGLIPIALIAWVVWRVIAERLNNTEDDHYDKIEK
ncbi:hypothetical protein [Oceaniglobus indicus]|uniref:hypothetical protein n=1 Tax=Oceaniglobus indicus TaxID=2047749 RepID=UPI000C1A60F9|nr:hypothetical protein [Oceaniglobus indicus]